MNNRHVDTKRGPLDFIVIGAQKSGTTTLHMLLRKHKQIYLPLAKEVPYFSDDDRYAAGWEQYERDFYGTAEASQLRGKVTNYMCDPRSPQRIRDLIPHAKLIAILRDPVDRAFSHYRMCVRRGLDKRAFPAAIIESLRSENIRIARESQYIYRDEPNRYVVWGEYGRILSHYVRLFPAENILVLFNEDLRTDPAGVLNRLLRFLDLPIPWSPPNLGKSYHTGGNKYRFAAWRSFFRALPGSGRIAAFTRRSIGQLPRKYQLAFTFWKEILLTKPTKDEEPGIDPETRSILVNHFSTDVVMLANIFRCVPPWENFSELPQKSMVRPQ